MPVGRGPSAQVGVVARREGCGVVRSTGWALGASGVVGADGPTPYIPMSSSPSREQGSSSSEWGVGSWHEGGRGRALQSLEKASWSQPQLGQSGGEVG